MCIKDDIKNGRLTPLDLLYMGYRVSEIAKLYNKTTEEIIKEIGLILLKKGFKIKKIVEYLEISSQKLIPQIKTSLNEKIQELYSQGTSKLQIAGILGISLTYIHANLKIKDKAEKIHDLTKDQIKKLIKQGLSLKKISQMHNIPITDIRELLKPDIVLRYLQLKGFKFLASEFRMHTNSIKEILVQTGINIHSSGKGRILEHLDYRYWVPLPNHVKEIISGELLGDGYLTLSKKEYKDKSPAIPTPSLKDYKGAVDTLNKFQQMTELKINNIKSVINQFNKALEIISNTKFSRFTKGNSLIEKRLSEHIGKIFNANGLVTDVQCYYKKGNKNSYKTGDYFQVNLQTKVNFQLRKLKEIWYPKEKGGKKSVPKGLKITPTIH
ncbi:MAG: hypothetical protein ACXAC7_02530 [Candidatus Hodarchaeales archaeon]|jgi:DNA-binding transcriptional MerR regulator